MNRATNRTAHPVTDDEYLYLFAEYPHPLLPMSEADHEDLIRVVFKVEPLPDMPLYKRILQGMGLQR